MDNTHEKKSKGPKRSGAGLPFLTAEDILNVGKSCSREESPINLSFDIMKEIRLSPLEWENFEVTPKLMKISNCGMTAFLSAKWHGPRPYLANGPVSGKYVFSQLHFHWGRSFQEGSEHRINGQSLPLEAHALFFKNIYISQDNAMKRNDGIVTVAYFFNLQEKDNENLKPITSVLPDIAVPLTSQHISTVPLNQFMPAFSNDYFLYWGNVDNMCVLWFICRKPLSISPKQLLLFQRLIGSDKKPIERNFREPRDLNNRVVFHVNPSENKAHPLLPFTADDKKKEVPKTVTAHNLYSLSTVHQNVLNQPLYTVAENKQGVKDAFDNGDVDNLDNEPGLKSGDTLGKKDSVTDLLDFGLKRKPDVKELKCTLARILLELEKKEDNDDFGVLENYLKAKYAAAQERHKHEKCSQKVSEDSDKKKNDTEEIITNVVSGEEINNPINSLTNGLVKNPMNENNILYENSIIELEEKNTPSIQSGTTENTLQMKTEYESSFEDSKENNEKLVNMKTVDTISTGKNSLCFEQSYLQLCDKGRPMSASESNRSVKLSARCTNKSELNIQNNYRARKSRLAKDSKLSLQHVERFRETVTFTANCEVQETLTVLEKNKSDTYSVQTSEFTSSESNNTKPISSRDISEEKVRRKECKINKSTHEHNISAIRERLKNQRLKAIAHAGEGEKVERTSTPIKKLAIEKNIELGEKYRKAPQESEENDHLKRRAMIRNSWARPIKQKPLKETLPTKTKTPERPPWKP